MERICYTDSLNQYLSFVKYQTRFRQDCGKEGEVLYLQIFGNVVTLQSFDPRGFYSGV